MCGGKSKPDPRIKEEEEKTKAAAEAAKEAAIAEQVDKRMKELEAERETQATAAATKAAQAEKDKRQAELERSQAEDRAMKAKAEKEAKERKNLLDRAKGSFVSGSEVTSSGVVGESDAATRRRSTRGGRGRRSLLTSSAGGMGYFSRFL